VGPKGCAANEPRGVPVPEVVSAALVSRRVRTSAVVGIDETGLRQDGVRGDLWLARTDTVSLFRAELSRGVWVAVAMLGKGFAGVVLSDFYGAYTAQTPWQHGYGGAHLMRDAKALAELVPCAPTAEFRDRLAAFYLAGKAAQASGEAAAIKGARVRFGHLHGRAPACVGPARSGRPGRGVRRAFRCC
jgi:Transposase IS66 family